MVFCLDEYVNVVIRMLFMYVFNVGFGLSCLIWWGTMMKINGRVLIYGLSGDRGCIGDVVIGWIFLLRKGVWKGMVKLLY